MGGEGKGGEGKGGEGTGRGVVAGWKVLEDEVPGQRRVPLLVYNNLNYFISENNFIYYFYSVQLFYILFSVN